MTNLIAGLILSVTTNWTGTVVDGREAGIVITNYQARVIYGNITNEVQLKRVASDRVVWRKDELLVFYTHTNIVIRPQGIWFTNVNDAIYEDWKR